LRRSGGIAVALTVAGLALRLAFAGAPGQSYDLAAFAGWAIDLQHHAPWDFHSFSGYPPGYFLVLLGVGKAYGALAAAGADPHDSLLRVLVKLPPIVADVADAWLIAAIARCLVPGSTLIVASAWLFNPVALIDGAYWGQIDAVPWAPALAAVLLVALAYRAESKLGARFGWAWFALCLSLLIKPQAAPLGLVLALAVVRAPSAHRRIALAGSALGIAAAALVGWALCALFSGQLSPIAAFGWLFRELTAATNGVSVTSANAFNAWSVLFPFYVPDAIRVGGVSLALIGLTLAGAATAAILVRFAQRPGSRTFVEAAALVMLACFIFSTRMHERYILGAVMLAVALAPVGTRWFIAACLLTLTTTVDLLYALAFGALFDPYDPFRPFPWVHNVRDFWPLVSHPLSLLNVMIFGVLCYAFLRGDRVPRRGAATEHSLQPSRAGAMPRTP
jgi:Gpi18-like mannosyltransferase